MELKSKSNTTSCKPSCSKVSDAIDSSIDDMEVDAAEEENMDREEEDEAEGAGGAEQEEEAEEQDEVDEVEEEMVSKVSVTKRSGDTDLFSDFEFGTNKAEEVNVPREEMANDIGDWTDSSKICSAAVNLSRKFICIDYPGVIKNVDRAMKTLGGEQFICKCLKDNHKLELSFRPKDPYCKPVISTVNPTRNLLLKIRRRRKVESGCEPGEQFEYQVEVMGAVENIYTFDKMCDFQYLPVIKLPDGQYKEILSSIRPNIDDEREEYLARKIPLFLPPFCFSRREAPTHFFFDNDNVQEGETALGNDRKKRYCGVIHRGFNNPDVPDRPEPAAFENVSKVPEHNKILVIESLTKLFEERPLWIKTAIMAKIDPSHHRIIKHVLPMVAYYIETGPWRNLWCKYGYDPRKDPKAKMYQTLDFRLRTKTNKNQVEAKRGVESPRFVHSMKKNLPTNKVPIHHVEEKKVTVDSKTNPGGLDLTYIFTPDYKPPYRQMRYQVCDVFHDKVQKMLHENDGKETECTERDGWCVPDFTDMCRDIMSATVEKLFQN